MNASEHNPPGDGDEEIDKKDAWQVVSCPQCRAPKGMRCKSSLMKTHAPRKKAFFAKLEQYLEDKARKKIEQKIRGKALIGDLAAKQGAKGGLSRSNTHATRAPSSCGLSDASKGLYPAVNMSGEHPAGSGSGMSAGAQRESSHAHATQGNRVSQTIAKSAGNNSNTRDNAHSKSQGSPSWISLAEQLRADLARRNLLATGAPGTPGPARGDSAKPRKALKDFSEDATVWQTVACPTCRASIGMRCFETLGQSRHSSHAARLVAYEKKTNG